MESSVPMRDEHANERKNHPVACQVACSSIFSTRGERTGLEGKPPECNPGALREAEGVKKMLYTSIVTSVPLNAGVRDCGSM